VVYLKNVRNFLDLFSMKKVVYYTTFSKVHHFFMKGMI